MMGHIRWVLEHSDSQNAQRLVMVVLALYANEEHVSYPAVGTVADLTRLSERSVQYALRALVDDGELVELPEPSEYDTKRYRLPVGEARLSHSAPEYIVLSKRGQSSLFGLESSGQSSSDSLRVQSETDSEISDVWSHYQQVMPNGSRYRLDTRRRRVIKRALHVRTIDQCKRAISGLAHDHWFLTRNFLDIRYALGKPTDSPDDVIDRMAKKAPEFPSSSSVPSDEPATLRRETEIALDDLAHKVSLMLERPFGVNLADGLGAIEILARYGLEIALDEARTRVVRLGVVPVEDARIMRVQPLLAERLRSALGLV